MYLDLLKKWCRDIDTNGMTLPPMKPNDEISYLLLKQIEMAEQHMAEVREHWKADEAWEEEMRAHNQRYTELQERHVEAEEQLVAIHRQHVQNLQEQQKRFAEELAKALQVEDAKYVHESHQSPSEEG